MRITILVLGLIALAVTPVLAQQADREFGDHLLVIDKSGKVVSREHIKITSADYDSVIFDQRGQKGETIAANRVLAITYGDAPRIYLEGLTAFTKGKLADAASDFEGSKTAVDQKKVRPWLLEYASVGRARAFLAMAAKDSTKAGDAIDEFKKALEANPKSFLFDEIQLGLAKAYFLTEKYADATTAAKALADIGTKTKNPVWLCEGDEQIARILVAQSQFLEAENAWQSLLDAAKREIQYADSAVIKKKLKKLEITGAVEQGWAKIYRAEKSGAAADWSDAQSYFTGLDAQYPKDEVVAAAVLNGTGRCLLESNPRSAIMKFAEAEATHFTAKNEVARALYLESKAYAKWAKKTGNAFFRTMKEEALKELHKFYGDTEWAKK